MNCLEKLFDQTEIDKNATPAEKENWVNSLKKREKTHEQSESNVNDEQNTATTTNQTLIEWRQKYFVCPIVRSACAALKNGKNPIQ